MTTIQGVCMIRVGVKANGRNDALVVANPCYERRLARGEAARRPGFFRPAMAGAFGP